MDYKTKAVNCLKNTALPVLLQRFREWIWMPTVPNTEKRSFSSPG